MRICLVGDFSSTPDEAMRVVARRLAGQLEGRHQVLKLDIKTMAGLSTWSALRRFRPEIVHYIPGPSLASLMLMKAVSRFSRNAKTVVSAMHPHFGTFAAGFIKRLKPDLVLVQSSASEQVFKDAGCATAFLPNGVDTDLFQPVSAEVKATLRRRYAMSRERFIILHVGAIRQGRGVRALIRLQSPETQVVILAATSSGVNQSLLTELRKSGVMVLTSYIEKVAELYTLADCYVFPAPPANNPLSGDDLFSIEMPLSVLEAMSCNLPVIATPFGALPRVFAEGQGFFYGRDEFDFARALQQIKAGLEICTREMALPYSWAAVAAQLETLYTGLLAGEAGA